MPATAIDPVEVLRHAGIDMRRNPPSEDLINHALMLIEKLHAEPQKLVGDTIAAQREVQRVKQLCGKAAGNAEKLQELIDNMLLGNAQLLRLEQIRHTPRGPRAICRLGGQLQSLTVHEDVPLELLERLRPWDYVCVRENVVIDVWTDDPELLVAAQGEVVDFKGYADEEQHLVRIGRHGQEELATLVGPVRDEPLTPRSKLVLHRDNQRLAIASLPADRPESQFEVSIDQITTRLEDLAGMEAIAEKLMLDIYKRIILSEVRDTYDLDPLRGMLLLSYAPGMGKTAFVRAFARWLSELGEKMKFEVVLYVVPPNSTKSMWHGEDARIVREDIFGAIRARREVKRDKTLLQLLVLDEIDCLGRRPEASERVASSAASDSVQSFLAEMDGMLQEKTTDPPAHLLAIGMSNRPDQIDVAMKRPGRFGDSIVEMPAMDRRVAEQICAVYARKKCIPFQLNGKPDTGVSREDLLAKLIRPALARVFDAVVVRYSTDTQRKFDVTAGELLVGTHYRAAMNAAKNRASDRYVLRLGSPAVKCDDLVAGLFDAALAVAASMQADPLMLVRQLQVKVPVVRVEAVPREELDVSAYWDEQV